MYKTAYSFQNADVLYDRHITTWYKHDILPRQARDIVSVMSESFVQTQITNLWDHELKQNVIIAV